MQSLPISGLGQFDGSSTASAWLRSNALLISAWCLDQRVGLRSLSKALVEHGLKTASGNPIDKKILRQVVRSEGLEPQKRYATAPQSSLPSPAPVIPGSNESVAQSADEWFQEAMRADKAREDAEARLSAVTQENNRLRAKIADLSAQIEIERKRARANGGTETMVTPRRLEDIAKWAQARFEGRLVLHRRAVKGLEKGVYRDPAKVAACLEALATEYRDSRLGVDGALERFQNRIDTLRVINKWTCGDIAVSRWPEIYTVEWNGERHRADRHLCHGNGGDPSGCMRIYFFWDDVSKIVVVASAPQHLRNQLTN